MSQNQQYLDSNKETQIQEMSVTASDNARLKSDGTMRLKDSYLQLGGRTDGQNKHAIRFENVVVPSNSEIVNAYIEFYAYSTSPMCNVDIFAELGDPLPYTTVANDMTDRTYGIQKVYWVTDSLVTNYSQIITPNLKNLIDENRLTGWEPGESLAFIFMGLSLNGGTNIRAFDGGIAYRPKLRIEYIDNGNGPVINETISEKVAIAITTGNDDASESDSGKISFGDTSLRLGGQSESLKTYAFRFQSVNLPDSAEVKNAYIEFYTHSTSPSANMSIQAELGNSIGYINEINSITNRHYSKTHVNWVTDSCILNTMKICTPNLKNIIDESRIEGFKASQDVGFLIKGLSLNGGARISTYESNVLYRPRLIIEYEDNGKGPFIEMSLEGKSASLVMDKNDDGRQNNSGSMALSAAYLQLGGRNDAQLHAVRFQQVDIPASAEISDAYIEFYAYGKSPAAEIDIRVELGTSLTYSTVANNISSRTYTSNKVKWETTEITTDHYLLRTPSLKNIIDESRLRGWKSESALSFLFTGLSHNNGTSVRSYEGGELYRPRLIVTYLNNGEGPSVESAETDLEKISELYINEISSQGSLSQKEDWIELYNNNESDIVIGGGVFISNKNDNKKLHELKNIFVPAKGTITLIADKKNKEGNNHLSFDLKNSGGTIYLSKIDGDSIASLDEVTYPEIPYKYSYGRLPNGVGEFMLFISPSYDTDNVFGQHNINVVLSHQRGVYPSNFDLTIEVPDSVIVKYTLDCTTPSDKTGEIYTSPITISKTSVVKIYAYNETGNSGLLTHTFVLKNNYDNEKAGSGMWTCKSTINADEYAEAIGDIPVVSISTASEPSSSWRLGEFEYLDNHIYSDRANFHSTTTTRKFGQESIGHLNSGIKFKFNKDALVKKANYPFFDPYPGDLYPTVNKIQTIELKEGQDGPSRNVFGLGFMRYSEKIVMNLQKEMGKFALDTRHVHLIVNGKYRGVKTMRNDYKPNNIEEVFGDDADNYTKVDLQDARFTHGTVAAGDGDPVLWKQIQTLAGKKDLQNLKEYVDIDDLIKFQIIFMFIDTENEATAIFHNDAPNYMKTRFMINDTDGSFFGGVSLSNGNTTMQALRLAGGGGTYKYKWNSSTSKNGPAGIFGNFMGVAGNPNAGNLEFKTMVKDLVLALLGPATGDFQGGSNSPLSVTNVTTKMVNTIKALEKVYKLDAAFQSFGNRKDVYNLWLNVEHPRILKQVPERVSFSIKKWLEYNMAHTLPPVDISIHDNTLTIDNPADGTDVYYTLDGSDPMGNDGIIAGTLYSDAVTLNLRNGSYRVVARAFENNNWGPKSEDKITITSI
ncbi:MULTISPECIES: FN3 associated domain-containing protein [Serratia]|uniref:FN3 associated domain-containing protein n=1 Tax=Serratia TaxID=613 RepID=UPI00384DB050